MKNKHMIFSAFLVLSVLSGGIFSAGCHKDNSKPVQSPSHEGDQGDVNQPGVKGQGGVVDEHDHEEGSDIIEMTPDQQKEIGLVLAHAESGNINRFFSFVGEVRLNEDRMAHVFPNVPGIVNKVSVVLGERVYKGQVLAVIDSHKLLEMKTDYLGEMRNLDLTRRTFERKQYLKQENIASEADWLEAQSAYQNAETMLSTAKRRLVVLGLSEEEIKGISGEKDDAFRPV